MIVRMEEKHLKEVLNIEHLVFSTPWQEKDFLFELNDNPVSFYYVYLIDEHVAGFIGSWINYEQGEITNVAVHPDYLCNGVGAELLKFAEQKARAEGCIALRLDMVKGNAPAASLYKKCGYQYIDTISLGYEEYGLPWYDLYEKIL